MSNLDVEDQEEQCGHRKDAVEGELANEDLEEASGGRIPCFPELPLLPDDPFVPPGSFK